MWRTGLTARLKLLRKTAADMNLPFGKIYPVSVFFLYGELNPQTDTQNVPPSQDNLRIRKMLAYIHKNFADDISLSEISSAAGISERESLRCFKKTIQLSPIQYLLKYRIMQGAEMLRKHPADSISEIATLCGFDSPSNFAKIFKRFYNCTPREYRNKL